MSLILDALKKLDREKEASSRGLVVVGAARWGESERRLGPRVVAAGVAALAAAGLALWLQRTAVRTAAPRASSAPPSAAAAVLTPPVSAAPSPFRPAPPAAPSPPQPTPLRPTPAPPSAGDEPEAAGESPAPARPAPPRGQSTRESSPPYRLTAIAHRDGHPVAVLNDRLVREGDSFDGVTVVRIGTSEIEIEVRGRRLVIEF